MLANQERSKNLNRGFDLMEATRHGIGMTCYNCCYAAYKPLHFVKKAYALLGPHTLLSLAFLCVSALKMPPKSDQEIDRHLLLPTHLPAFLPTF